jgi:hypothetical protein
MGLERTRRSRTTAVPYSQRNSDSARKGIRGGPRVRKLRAMVAKADQLEYITTDRLVWVVLFNADLGESLNSMCLR